MSVVMEIVLPVGVLIIGISLMICIHACVTGRVFRDDPRLSTVSTRTDQMPSMRPEDIEELPSFEYKMEDDKGGDCAVCLECFKAEEKCRFLPKCNHSFHAECIDSWLKKTGACPVCRTSANHTALKGV